MLLNRHSIIPVSLLCFAVVISASPAISNRPRSVLSVCQVDLNNVTFTRLLDCVRDKSLLYLDRITATDSIDVLGGGAVKLVRRKDQSSSPVDATNDLQEVVNSNSTWAINVVHKLTHLLRTHVLQIDVHSSTNPQATTTRGRRRRNQMMLPAMLFGIIAIGMVLVPMGFQFLSMFAGKAILLSKLALMLASLNGLKRVANAGIQYGLYTAPDPPPHPQYLPPHYPRPHWDRSDQPRAE